MADTSAAEPGEILDSSDSEMEEHYSPPASPKSKRTKVDWQEKLLTLVTNQQQQLLELTQHSLSSRLAPTVVSNKIAQPSSSTHVSFHLSEFDPEKSDYVIEEWLDIATNLKQEENVGDGLMIAKAGEALKGRAHRYYCDWRPISRTWDEFCKDLIVTFPDRETAGARAFTAATLRSRDCNSLSDYGIRKLQAIKRFHGALPWTTIISMVEYGLDHSEAQSAIRIQKPNTNRDLIKLLNEYDARRKKLFTVQNKRYNESFGTVSVPNLKRNIMSTKGLCFRCGQSGHHQSSCRSSSSGRQNKSDSEEKALKTTDLLKCAHCNKVGHTEKACWSKHGRPRKTFVLKK